MLDVLEKVLAIAGLVLGLIWLLSVAVSGFTAPAWVGPAGLACTAAAVVLMVMA